MVQCGAYPTASEIIGHSEDLHQTLNTVVKIIEDGLDLKTVRIATLEDCVIEDRISCKPIMELKPSEEVVEVTVDQFSRIVGCAQGHIAGSYCTKTGRIFIITGEWCLSNLIHEVLHSRSTFSRFNPPPKNLEFVYEGLTELLTGIVLKAKVKDCYKEWRSLDSCFLQPYTEFVKPWYYIIAKTNASAVISFYFNTQVQNPYEDFGQLLQQLLDNEFENVFMKCSLADYSIADRFNDELSKVFPKDFAEFVMTPLVEINLDDLDI